MLLVVGESTYEMNKKQALAVIKVAKNSMREKGVANAIVALEKDRIIDMRKDLFESSDGLNRMKAYYKKQGFKVYAVESKEEIQNG